MATAYRTQAFVYNTMDIVVQFFGDDYHNAIEATFTYEGSTIKFVSPDKILISELIKIAGLLFSKDALQAAQIVLAEYDGKITLHTERVHMGFYTRTLWIAEIQLTRLDTKPISQLLSELWADSILKSGNMPAETSYFGFSKKYFGENEEIGVSRFSPKYGHYKGFRLDYGFTTVGHGAYYPTFNRQYTMQYVVGGETFKHENISYGDILHKLHELADEIMEEFGE